MATRVVVRAEGFTYRYPALVPGEQPQTALDNLTFAIPARQVVGLVGASGSGLTTLCLALAGLVPYETGGTVRGWLVVAGQETTSVPPAELARSVGIVFEDPEANLIGLSVADEVAFALELRGLPPREVAQRSRGRSRPLVSRTTLIGRPGNFLAGRSSVSPWLLHSQPSPNCSYSINQPASWIHAESANFSRRSLRWQLIPFAR